MDGFVGKTKAPFFTAAASIIISNWARVHTEKTRDPTMHPMRQTLGMNINKNMEGSRAGCMVRVVRTHTREALTQAFSHFLNPFGDS
jgi:hypothetical protein